MLRFLSKNVELIAIGEKLSTKRNIGRAIDSMKRSNKQSVDFYAKYGDGYL